MEYGFFSVALTFLSPNSLYQQDARFSNPFALLFALSSHYKLE